VFTSPNGVNWQQRYSTTIAMGSCIQAGIFTESVRSNRTSIAWFDHVEVVSGLKSGKQVHEIEIAEKSTLLQVELYPNPTEDQVTISIPGNENKVSYQITDMNGRLFEQSHFTGSEAVLDLSGNKPGIYILRMEVKGEVVTRRIVVM
jgi:hypothetical protein